MTDQNTTQNQPSGDAVDMLQNDFDAFFEFLTEGAQDGVAETPEGSKQPHRPFFSLSKS
jgi:hypothetical protein